MPIRDFSSPGNIVEFVVSILLLALFDFMIFLFVRRKLCYFLLTFLELVFLASWVFELELLTNVSLLFLGVASLIFLFVNMSEYRVYIANGLKGKSPFNLFKKKAPVPEAIFDREQMYQEIYKAVVDMSRKKEGALITFQKKDNILDESKIGNIIKQRGVDVNAPVSSELIETIFYEGTLLHDGAIIIKNDTIVRAAVFFASTTQPVTGKFGSRHQAALGISENSDSVTVIVSEETGRIAIAFQGEMTTVTPDNFLRVFEDDMAYDNASGSGDYSI